MARVGGVKFKRFNLVRRITRETFVNGYRNFAEYMYIESEDERKREELQEEGKRKKKTGYSNRAYKENLLIAHGCLEGFMACPAAKTSSIAYDEMRVINNPFYRLLKANVMKADQQYFFFALTDMLRQHSFLSIDEIKDIYGKEYGCYKDSTIRGRLKEYADLGLLVWRREKRKDMYGIAPLRPYDGSYSGDQKVEAERGICGCHRKLLRAVSFFSEASPLGIVGNQILDACNAEQKIFSFKNSFISQALDSIVLSDILEAIHQQQTIEVRVEQTRDGVVAVSNVLPICVLSSAWDGRQYVFVYDTEGKRYKSQRLDYIHSVAPCKSNSVVDVNDVIDKSREVLRTMWAGNYLKYETPSHVVIDFAFDSEKEKHINQRVERECREPLAVGSYAGNGERKVEGDVCHPLELVPWILSYTGYIDNLLVKGTKKQREVLGRICEHIQNLYRRYHYGSEFVYKSLEKYSPITKEYLEKWDTGEDTSPIFSDVSSYYSVTLKRIVSQFDTPKTKSEATAIITAANNANGFRDASLDISLRKLCSNGMLTVETVNKEPHYSSIFADAKCRPFTAYELRWLYTILQDERIYLFLSQDEVECLKVALEANGCRPLYTYDSFRYFDVYNDGDEYSDPIYREIFETICQAIEDGNSQLEVEYIPENGSKKGTDAVSHRVVPVRLEYSKLDNKFKLIAYEIGEKTETKKGHRTIRNLQVFRLSRMTKVKCVPDGEVAPELLDYSAAVDVLDKPLEVIVYPFKNVFERFFIAFSAYRKSVEYDEASGVCYVKLWFVARDRKEVYCKLRSFGQGIEVVSPSKVRKEYFVRRVDRQYWNLIKSGLVNKCKEPITVKVYENTLSRDSFKKNFSHYQIDIEPESENNAYIARIWYAESDEQYVRAELKGHEFDLDIVN